MANETTKLQIMQEMSSLINELCSQDISILRDLAEGYPVSMEKIENMLANRVDAKLRNHNIMKLIDNLILES